MRCDRDGVIALVAALSVGYRWALSYQAVVEDEDDHRQAAADPRVGHRHLADLGVVLT
jgi:hypothetical protein